MHPPARFGALELDGERVARFSEKPQTERDWINGGFFVFEPGLLDYIKGPQTSLELDVLERVAADGQLMAYRHEGYFQPMDTLREKLLLEDLWKRGAAPWTAPP
jgi:glucose-1-phosphate cytidylyltransferase